jgi:CubicO group peptidase (beta-lactamase class C family)
MCHFKSPKRIKGMMKRTVALLIGFAVLGTPLVAQMDTAARIKRVENGLLPPVLLKGEPGWTMRQRMEHYKAPGVSIAVIDSFRVAWVRAYGVKDAGTQEPVTTQTLFQAASISKPVNATAVMLEVQRGKLYLDDNVNRYLSSWKLPDNALTANTNVTPSNLLSHTGGTTVSGFPGYAPTAPLPTVQQILSGTPPANTSPIVVDLKPGTRFRYSGGGITITQLVLMELEGKPYPQILKELVLDPIGMASSTFSQPLPASRVSEAAVAHGPDGTVAPEKFHIYPELAAAGLWTTPTDLAKFAIEHQLSLKGKSNKILSPEFEERMMTPYIAEGYGLGFGVEKKGNAEYFQHSGGNYGFNCLLIAHKRRGYGAVVMLNSNAYALIPEIIRSIAKEYEWEDYLPALIEVVHLDHEKLQRATGRYLLGRDEVVRIDEEAGKLFAKLTLSPQIELLPVSDTEFVSTDIGRHVVLLKGGGPQHDTLKIFGDVSVLMARRLSEDDLSPHEFLLTGDIAAAVHQYRAIKQTSPSDPSIVEARLNQMGYQLLNNGKIDAAIAIFTTNVEFYPKSWNVYDSLGEAFAKKGDKRSAIQNYQQALRLNPAAETSKKALQELKE